MFRTMALSLAVGALALPAFAATSIPVNVSGLDAKATHSAIVHAAIAACEIELRQDSSLVFYYEWQDCTKSAIAGAEASIAPRQAELTPSPSRLASR
jgi:hypothetical protein